MAGCVVCETDEQYIGVENDTLKKVECGQTTRDWVIETFGEPSEQILTDDGGEILKYKSNSSCFRRLSSLEMKRTWSTRSRLKSEMESSGDTGKKDSKIHAGAVTTAARSKSASDTGRSLKRS